MKKIFVAFVALFCAVSLFAKGDLHIFEIANKDGKVTPQTIEKAFAANGFTISVNSEMNYPYKKQFNQTNFKTFNLLTVYHTKLAHELVQKHAVAGVLTPMGVGIFQGLNDDTLHVSILTAEAMGKILGIKEPMLETLEKEVLKAMKAAAPSAKHRLSEDSLGSAHDLVTKYELALDGAEWEGAKEELEMRLENGFEPYGFVMPNYLDYQAEMSKTSDESAYDFFSTYSICKLKVIYTVSKSRPEAAAFAPCSLMVYKKKDEDKIVLGFPGVYNWLSSARVEDKEAHDVLMQAQKDFESILKEVTE